MYGLSISDPTMSPGLSFFSIASSSLAASNWRRLFRQSALGSMCASTPFGRSRTKKVRRVLEHIVFTANDHDHRSRATGSQIETEASSRDSVHPLVEPRH